MKYTNIFSDIAYERLVSELIFGTIYPKSPIASLLLVCIYSHSVKFFFISTYFYSAMYVTV
jgi:hypothetical protein